MHTRNIPVLVAGAFAIVIFVVGVVIIASSESDGTPTYSESATSASESTSATSESTSRERERRPSAAHDPQTVAAGREQLQAYQREREQRERADTRTSESTSATSESIADIAEEAAVNAEYDCKIRIEAYAKYSYEWNVGFFGNVFTGYRTNLDSEGYVVITGDKLYFTNGFGAKVPMIYSCTVNPADYQVISVTVNERG